jgi:hypothetical protein
MYPENNEHSFHVFERKIIWRIYGPIRIEGNGRVGTNKEIDELIGHEAIVSFAKSLRMGWIGHVERKNNNRMPKMILNAKMEGGRR